MTTENKKIQTADCEQSCLKTYTKNKNGKYLNPIEKSLAEFYIELILAKYFWILDEQEPLKSHSTSQLVQPTLTFFKTMS